MKGVPITTETVNHNGYRNGVTQTLPKRQDTQFFKGGIVNRRGVNPYRGVFGFGRSVIVGLGSIDSSEEGGEL